MSVESNIERLERLNRDLCAQHVHDFDLIKELKAALKEQAKEYDEYVDRMEFSRKAYESDQDDYESNEEYERETERKRDSEIKKADTMISNLRRQIAEQSEKISNLYNKLDQQDEIVQDLEAELRGMQIQMKDREVEIEENEKEMEGLAASNKEKDERIEKLEAEKEELQKKVLELGRLVGKGRGDRMEPPPYIAPEFRRKGFEWDSHSTQETPKVQIPSDSKTKAESDNYEIYGFEEEFYTRANAQDVFRTVSGQLDLDYYAPKTPEDRKMSSNSYKTTNFWSPVQAEETPWFSSFDEYGQYLESQDSTQTFEASKYAPKTPEIPTPEIPTWFQTSQASKYDPKTPEIPIAPKPKVPFGQPPGYVAPESRREHYSWDSFYSPVSSLLSPTEDMFYGNQYYS